VDLLEFPNQKLRASGGVGIEHGSAGLIEALLNVWHGLEPWNVTYEEDFYDRLLCPGVTRPPTAVVLSPGDRARYREAMLRGRTTTA
jgi:hypothetical protein